MRGRLIEVAPAKPLFLKIAPDLGPEAVDAVVDVARGVRAWIGAHRHQHHRHPPLRAPAREGGRGLSGAPSRAAPRRSSAAPFGAPEGALPIIGVGGVSRAQDAYAKIRAGASAVQVYTGFIYEGPVTVGRMLRELAALLRRDGFTSVADAVGADDRPPRDSSVQQPLT